MDGIMVLMPRNGTLYLRRAQAILVTLPNGDQLVRIDGGYVWVRP